MSAPRSAPRSVWDAISGPAALHESLAIIVLPFTVMTVAWTNSVSSPSSVLTWAFFGLAAHLAMVLAAIPIRLWIIPPQRQKTHPLLSLAVYAFLGLVRGLAVALLANITKADAETSVLIRVIAGVLLTTSVVPLLVWFADSRLRNRAAVAQLVSTRAALREARQRYHEILGRERERLREIVATSVTAPIEAIRTHLLAQPVDRRDITTIIEMVNETIDERIKPLSRRLATDIRTWSPPLSQTPPARTQRPTINYFITNPFRPFVLGLVCFLAPALSLTRHISVARAWAVTAFLAALVSALTFSLQWFFTTRIGRMPAKNAITFVTGTSLVVGYLSVVGTAPLAKLGKFEGQFEAAGIVGIAIIGFIIVLAIAVDARHEAIQALLTSENRELGYEVARISGELWSEQSRVAETLHGQVQSSLIVTAARLMSASSESDVTEVQRLLKPIDDALDSLNRAQHDNSFTQFVAELRDVWADVMEITVDADPATLEVLARLEPTRAIIATVIRDAATNAFRAGHAQRMAVQVVHDRDELHLTVTNDGLPESPHPTTGFGTQLLRATALRWSRGPEKCIQTLRADFPAAAPPC